MSREPSVVEQTFNPSRVSPSRVNKLSECGIAFRRYYLDREPTKVQGSYALRGTVVHAALEKWSVNREQDLLSLMRQAWQTETEGTPVADFLREYAKINVEVLKAEQKAREKWEADPRNAGKKSKAPRMTKHFKDSPAAKKLNRLLSQWIPKLDRESPWRFEERDPITVLYDETLVAAKRYQARYGHLPPSLHTEFSFDVPWRGFQLIGYIDDISPLVTPEGEMQGIGVHDYKTYRTEPAPFKDWRQMVMYDIAVRFYVEQGIIQLPFSLDDYPLLVGMDYVLMAGVDSDWADLIPEGQESSGGNSRHYREMTAEDHDRLERELNAYFAIVENKAFMPAPKSANPKYCDYGDTCCMRSTAAAGGCAGRVEVSL